MSLCVSAVGCNPSYCTTSAEMRAGLVAEIELAQTALAVGGSYGARLRLKNSGPAPLAFCRDAGPSVGFLRAEGKLFPLKLAGQTLDVACAEEVSLAPGQALEQDFDVGVPALGVVEADLVTWYEVSTLPGCRRGSEAFQVSTSIPVVVEAPQVNE